MIHHWFPSPLAVRAGRFELPPEPHWQQKVGAARSGLEAIVGAVGRLECPELGPAMQCGTAWLIGGDVAVTNRHTILPLLDGVQRGTRTLRIDLCAEVDSEVDRRLPVRRVLYLAPDHDLAFLQVAHDRAPGITVADTIVADHAIAVIGFPADEAAAYASPQYDQCFKEGFDRHGRGFKRISLGNVLAVAPSLVEHDCTTLGGSSGGVIVDLVRGAAIGLNYGQSLERRSNLGVPCWLVRERLGRLDRCFY